MTPPRQSDEPAVPPQVKQSTVKQQRAEQRAAKVEAFKKKEAQRRRNRRIAWITGSVAVVAVAAFVVTSIIVTAPKPSASYEAGSDGLTIEGVETFENTAGHVEGTVDYAQIPPAGGEHNAAWLNCGIYDQPVPNENAVHALEHGAVWVTYDPSLDAETVDAIRAKMPSTYEVLSPFDGLPSPIVLSAWNAQLQLDSVDDPRFAQFFEEYWKSEKAPEPGAPCTGAFEAPGRVD
ncbi:DUF3105 domain-containing protein [Compostimonas suwonensis]|uniref:Uncharacterized protein DUF3105 n=1 Tax=Compostimonas suwonensis TaxID=1048394 RepID=A0A2M9BWR7_9MICO|nr:DUF3105 domain-containing protein [Compostimonas suwonensis]PJJ62389.1 uncharacterized protein DUF3105 [Compostimonas suwonensis]